MEAELRGASQGPAESSRATERDIRGGTSMLQQAIHPGLCDRAGRQQAHPPQVAPADTGHPARERSCYQRRMFSQPPGYIAPPPYDTPQKSSSVSQQGDTSRELESKKQTYWSHPILKKQDIAVDHRTRKTEGFLKPDADQRNVCPQYSQPEAGSPQGSSTGYVPRPHVQFKGMLSLQQPPIVHTFQNKADDPSSKIIEGRKFKLNKKAGGVTIFCLVSRIADAAEVPASPVCEPHTNLKVTGGGEAPPCEIDVSQTQKLADEVDYRVPPLPESQSEPSNTGDSNAQREAAACSETEKPEGDGQGEGAKDAESTAGMQSGKSASVRYPLWREPSLPVRCEHVTGLKAKSGEDESGLLWNKDVSAEIQRAVRTEDVEGEAGGAEGVLGADTTCVVVKMEQIPSPKKEQVHYFDAAPHPEPSEAIQSASPQEGVWSSSLPNQGGNTDQNTNLEPDSDILGKVEPEQRASSDPCASSSVHDRETLVVRAERILGISLHESMAEQQPEDAASLKSKADASFTAEVSDGETLAEDKTEQERSQSQLELDQGAFSEESAVVKDQADDKGGRDSAESQEGGSTTVHPETRVTASDENDKYETQADSDENAHEQSEKESTTVEDDTPSPLLSPSADSWPSPSLDCQSPDLLPPPVPSTSNPASISENPESECTHLDPTAPIKANVSSAPTLSQQSASPLPQDPQSTTSHESSAVDLGEDDKTSQLANIETSGEFEGIPKDENEEVLSQQHDEVREQAEDNNGGREIDLDYEQRVEKEEVLVDSGVEETETPAEVSPKLFQDEDNVSTEESPRSSQQLCEETEEHTEHIQMLEESNITHACLPPAGKCTDDMEPLKEFETGLLEEKTSSENNNQLIQSQEITVLQLCDTGNASITKATSDEQSERVTGDPTSLPRQEMGKEISSEIHTDTENQLKLDPSNSPPPPPPPPGFELLSASELPAPSQVPPDSGIEVVPFVKMDPEAAVTMETDISPLASCEESRKLPSSSDTLPGLLTSASPPLPLEGSQSAASDSALTEEPYYPKSLWDAVNRIRKHTAPDSENEEEELGEVWDPENVGEDSGRPRGAQDTTAERKEVVADESVKAADVKQTQQDTDEVQEGPLSCTRTSSHSSGEMVADEEEDNEDNSSETGTEFRTLEDEELCSAAEQSCIAESEDEDQGHQ